MAMIQREVRKRGFFGQIFKWLFIVFNVVMLIWMVGYWSQLGNLASEASSDAAQAGVTVGGTIGTGMILFMWVAGAVILGLFTLLTRGKKFLITEEH